MTGHTHGPVALETLREWAASDDPLLNDLAFHTAYEHPESVEGLSSGERLDMVLAFLRRALTGGYGDALPDGPYVLAHTVHGWLRRLAAAGDAQTGRELERVVGLLEQIAREGDAKARDVVLLGVLEHAFEDPRTRALFAKWRDDPDLADLYREAESLSAS